MGYCMKIVEDVATEVVTGDEDFLSILEKERPGTTWVYDVNNQAGMNYTDGVFWRPQPYPSWTLDANKVWQPPIVKDNDVWIESLGRWVTRDEYYKISFNEQARDYLKETDWYIIRNIETGVAIPADVLTERAKARADVVAE
jgi:hypothetical protein